MTTPEIMQCIQASIEGLTFLAVCVGGAFALHQWRKGNFYQRGEIVMDLIETIRNNEDIASVMDIIDWNDGFFYDGKFLLSADSRGALFGISDEDFSTKWIKPCLILPIFATYMTKKS